MAKTLRHKPKYRGCDLGLDVYKMCAGVSMPFEAVIASLEESCTAPRFDALRARLRDARARAGVLREHLRAGNVATTDVDNLDFVLCSLKDAISALRDVAHPSSAAPIDRRCGFFEDAPEPCVTTDSRGLILEANRLFGRSLQLMHNFARKPLVNFVHRADTGKMRDAIARLGTEGTIHDVVVRVRPRGGEGIFAVLVSAATRLPSPRAPGCIQWILHRVGTAPLMTS